MASAKNGHIETTELLLQWGADYTASNNDNITALAFAAHNGHSEITNLLIVAGANINKKDKWGVTPLLLAVKNGHVDVARILIDAGADIEIKDNEGLTPLMWSSLQGHHSVTDLLLETGATGMYFEGGTGRSFENAIVIKRAPNNVIGVFAEGLWVNMNYPEWEKSSQALISDNDKHYDVITYSTPKGMKKLYFDITDFFGKW